MRGWFKGRKYGGAVCVSAALLWLVCLAAPAGAFWGDYGPEPPPEIFGVRLGDDIRNYEGMAMFPGPYTLMPARKLYQRQEEKGLTFEGVPLRQDDPKFRPYYCTYKNKIFDISFYVHPNDYERTVQKISAMLGPPSGYRGRPIEDDSGYVWMDSEVFVQSSRKGSFYVQWLPIEKIFYGYYAEKWNKPVAFEGVTLGDKVAEYPFLKEIYREGPDVIHYVSEKPLPQGMDNYIFSAYRGRIYGVNMFFNNYTPGLGGEWPYALGLLGLSWDRENFFIFWGDVQVNWLRNNIIYVGLTPACWEANRAKLAYYRNVKPD